MPGGLGVCAAHLGHEGLALVLEQVEADLVRQQRIILCTHTYVGTMHPAPCKTSPCEDATPHNTPDATPHNTPDFLKGASPAHEAP